MKDLTKEEEIMDKYDKEIIRLRNKQDKERQKEEKKLLPQYKKDWIGRCFKYSNSYGGSTKPSERWFLYFMIKEIECVNYIYDGTPEPNFRCLAFQRDTTKAITIELDKFHHRFDDDYKEINPSEFLKEYNKLIKSLNIKLKQELKWIKRS